MDTRFALVVMLLVTLCCGFNQVVNVPPSEDFPITWEQTKKVFALSERFTLSEPERQALKRQLGRTLDLSQRAPAFASATGLKHCQGPAGIGPNYSVMWCQRCTASGPHWDASYFFYPDPERGTCTLQKAELKIRPSERRFLRAPDQRFFRELVRELNRGLHQAAQVRPYTYEQDREVSDVDFPNSWKSARRSAYLYAEKPKDWEPEPVSIVFLWQAQPYLNMLDTELDTLGFEQATSPSIIARSCQEARDTNCPQLLTARQDVKASGHQALIENHLGANLGRLAALSTGAAEYPALLYWTQTLAESLLIKSSGADIYAREMARLNQKFELLKVFHASYQEAHYGPVFQADFKQQLLKHDASTFWGQVAFLEEMRLSRELPVNCERGDELSKFVAAHCEAFLQRYPSSPLREEIRYEMARAYETLWSLSKSRPLSWMRGDSRVSPSEAEAARQKALAIYREQLPANAANPWFKERIFRLAHGIDSIQRAYACSNC